MSKKDVAINKKTSKSDTDTGISPKEKEEEWLNEIVSGENKKVKKAIESETDLSDIPINRVPGIGPALAEKLLNAGYLTLASIAHASTVELVERCEIGEHTAKRLINAARRQVGVTFRTAKTLMEERKKLVKIPVGCKSLDNLLDGGIELRSLTELSGEFRTGKTQLCFQLCVTTAMDKKYGGLGADVVYIDTEGTFRPERIIHIANRFGVSSDEILNKIHVGRAYNSDHQMALVAESPKILKEKGAKLIVVDSLTSHFRAEFIGAGSLLERQQKLNKFLHQLLRIADVYNVAVVATNQVMTKPDVLYGESIFPIGGNIVAHSCTTRIYLRKAKGEKRIARVIDSPYIPEIEAIFAITEKGIVDVEE